MRGERDLESLQVTGVVVRRVDASDPAGWGDSRLSSLNNREGLDGRRAERGG